MTNHDHAVIKAEYADYRRVKGRKAMQIICEVSLENAPDVHRILGEPGIHDKQIWVAIALLNEETGQAKKAPKAEKRKKRFEDMRPSQQAALLCKDAEFWVFASQVCGVSIDSEERAAEFVREECEVTSRSNIDTSGIATFGWAELLARFRNWQTEQRYRNTPAMEKMG